MTMNFFGKLKNLHSGPPAPPKRIDNNAGYGWPEDEFDEEYGGDTYEAPPCEPDVKMPSRQVEENVYLETRTSNPVVPGRQAAPPPRPAKVTPMGKVSKQPSQHDSEEFYIDPSPSFKKPPEVDRKEKPGKKSAPKRMAPSVRSPTSLPAPTPAAAPQAEEDVYLDPNEGEGENDDLYLEPTAACPPVMRAPMRMPPPSKTASFSSLVPLMKPPVPRAKSSSSFNEVKAVPPLDVRRSTFPSFPSKLPPPTPGAKPPIPFLKEAKPSPPPPPIEAKTAVSPTGMKATKQSGNEDREWFARDCDRKTAEDLLLRVNKDGAFLIRHSSAQNKAQAARQPYTLAVLYRQKVYNIPIRFLVETQGYALGKEGKKNEEIFSSLHEIISHHNSNQLLLIDSKSQAKYTTYLTHPARP